MKHVNAIFKTKGYDKLKKYDIPATVGIICRYWGVKGIKQTRNTQSRHIQIYGTTTAIIWLDNSKRILWVLSKIASLVLTRMK